MSYVISWVCLVLGMVIFRMVNPDTSISFQEHAAGAYFSACALAFHALIFQEAAR